MKTKSCLSYYGSDSEVAAHLAAITTSEIPEFPGYYAGDDGSIWSSKNSEPRQLSLNFNTSGYLRVNLMRDGKNHAKEVHRLVLLAFAGTPASGMQCCHNNGVKTDNRLENLRWDTAKANCADRAIHGNWNVAKGENATNSILSNDQAIEIALRLQRGDKSREIASDMGISLPSISSIKVGRNWSSVTGIKFQPRKTRTKSMLSYFGSASEVARKLGGYFDHCDHTTILACGGLSELPWIKSRAIVANDLNGSVINFYRCVKDDVKREVLQWRCEHTLSHPAELVKARELLLSTDEVDRAWAYWTMCWLGHAGKGGTKSVYNTQKPSIRYSARGGSNASRIRTAASDIENWANEFERCEFTQMCFRELVPNIKDEPRIGVYADFPWVGAGDLYLHSFTEQDHRDLREHLGRFKKATVLVRYGDDQLIRELYSDWEIIEAESRDQHNAVKGELWILNRRVPESGLLI